MTHSIVLQELMPLEAICDVIMGQSPPSSSYNQNGIGLPFYQGKAEFGDLYPTPKKWCTDPKKIAEPGDVVISVRAPVGPTNLIQERSCIGRGLAALRPKPGISTKYIMYVLRHTAHDLRSKATGTTFEAVSGKTLRRHLVPWIEPDEQQAIVDEIETQFARLNDAEAALRRSKVRLEKLDNSLLTSLIMPFHTETNELSHPEAAEDYFNRLKAELNVVLPDAWTVVTLEEIAEKQRGSIVDGPFGSNLKTAHYTDSGATVVRLQNIGQGEFIHSPAYISLEHFERLHRHNVQPDDVLIAILGSPNPRSCVAPESLGDAIVKADCIRVRVDQSRANPRFVSSVFNSVWIQHQFQPLIHGIGRPRINLRTLRSMPFALPPKDEQDQIVHEYERQLSRLTHLESSLDYSILEVQYLRQSILREAFGGTHGQ